MKWYVLGGVWDSELSVERTDFKTELDCGANGGHIAIDIERALQKKFRETKGQIETC